MTWITGGGDGRRWVEVPVRKRRKSPRALRFANLKVGDQIMKVWTQRGWKGGDDHKQPPREFSRRVAYYIVTDLWFDPVEGQSNPVAGQMVGIVTVRENGEPGHHKEKHTLRGLAAQSFVYADRDYITFCRDRLAAMREGGVIVGIGHGNVVRRRPKQPTGFLR